MPRDGLEHLQTQVDELVEALCEMVGQHCPADDDGWLDSNALTANAVALDVLGKHGKLELSKRVGRRVFGKWVDVTP